MTGEISLADFPIDVAFIGAARAPDVAASPRLRAVSAEIADDRIDTSYLFSGDDLRKLIMRRIALT